MDVPAGVAQEEGNTGFSIHLLFTKKLTYKNKNAQRVEND